MNGGFQRHPHQVPIYAPGKEPLPPGFTDEDRAVLQQTKKWEGYAAMAMESCALKTVMAGGAGAFDRCSLFGPKFMIIPFRIRLRGFLLPNVCFICIRGSVSSTKDPG